MLVDAEQPVTKAQDMAIDWIHIRYAVMDMVYRDVRVLNFEYERIIIHYNNIINIEKQSVY